MIKLVKDLNIPMSIAAHDADKVVFESRVDYLIHKAFKEQCITANLKLPIVTELAEIYRQAYKGV